MAHRSWSWALFAFAIVACSNARSALEPTTQVPTARAEWRVTLRVSGGFAGVDKELQLASTADFIAIDRRRNLHVSGQLLPEEADRIRSLIDGAKSHDTARQDDCRDCLLYDIQLQTDRQSMAWHLSDAGLAASGFEDLVTSLRAVMERAFSGR
jgi:hypothetical protein